MPLCAACHAADDSLLPKNFHSINPDLRRNLTDTTPPDRLNFDHSGKFFDAAKLERGIHVFLDGKEYFDVEDYCESAGWKRLPTGNGTNADRQARYNHQARVVTVRYEDI